MKNPILTAAAGATIHGVSITGDDIALERAIVVLAGLSDMEEQRGHHEAAKCWANAMQRAIKQRRPEIMRAWEECEREWLDDGIDFFQTRARA